MKVFLIAAALGAGAWAQTGLERPRLGTMLDASGAARPVYGVAGSLTLGDVTATGILSLACSRNICLAKTETSILSAADATDAPPGPALFALDGDAVFVYFPQSGQLGRWHDGQLDEIAFDTAGEVLSLRAGRGAVEFAVRLDGRVSIVRGSDVIDVLPDDAEPVLLLAEGVLFANKDGLVLRRPDGKETRFDLKAVETLLMLGEAYVQVRASGSAYALRIDPGREQLFLLPDSPP